MVGPYVLEIAMSHIQPWYAYKGYDGKSGGIGIISVINPLINMP